MQDNENRKEERLEGREISFSGMSAGTAEKQHGKLYRWFDNFWYHHKWATIAVLFVLIVVTVCVVQMCSRENEGDLSVVLAGPYGFTGEENGYDDVRACLSTYLPADYDESGEKKTDIVHYTIYSADQIAALTKQDVTVNTATNAQNFSSFFDYLKLGESAILFLDPYLFGELAKNKGYLADLGENFGYDVTDAAAVVYTDGDGRGAVLGIKLSETALWRDNAAIRHLPEDTVVCLLKPFAIGKNSKPQEYEKEVAYFKALLSIQ